MTAHIIHNRGQRTHHVMYYRCWCSYAFYWLQRFYSWIYSKKIAPSFINSEETVKLYLQVVYLIEQHLQLMWIRWCKAPSIHKIRLTDFSFHFSWYIANEQTPKGITWDKEKSLWNKKWWKKKIIDQYKVVIADVILYW